MPPWYQCSEVKNLPLRDRLLPSFAVEVAWLRMEGPFFSKEPRAKR